MEVFDAKNLMTNEELDIFWLMIFKRISKAILNEYKFVVAFELEELIGNTHSCDYNLTIPEDQYETFLNNYIKWSEDLDRFEECQKATDLLLKLKK